MRRIMWFKIGGQTIHLLKLFGIFILVASLFKVGDASYNIFTTASMAEAASMFPDTFINQYHWWPLGGEPFSKSFEFQDFVGVLMGPLANFFFWLGAATLGLMIYQSGKIIFPVEEVEQKISEHHRSLIRRAVEAHRAAKKK